jgi:ribose 1,5-bisphosphokinase
MSGEGRAPQPGFFIAIVGASGVGKDSLIRALERKLPEESFHFPRRVVTRPPDANESNLFLDADAFEKSAERGEFVLAWAANGHSYALPESVGAAIRAGRHVVANLSRKVIPILRGTFPRVLVVHVTADRSIVEARLLARGREGACEREERVLRGLALDAEVHADIRIENNGALDESAERLRAVLSRLPNESGAAG